jgi:hypothetical protein
MYSRDGYVQLAANQPFMTKSDRFRKYLGEIQSGSPKLCTDCHGAANSNTKGLKDYTWNLDPFKKPK